MSNNVQIPMWLFWHTLDFLEALDPSSWDPPFHQKYLDALYGFRLKANRIELRGSYAKIIFAEDEDSRHDARMQYLLKRHDIF